MIVGNGEGEIPQFFENLPQNLKMVNLVWVNAKKTTESQ